MKGFITALAVLFFSQVATAKTITLTSFNHCSLEDQVDGNSMYELSTCLADQVVKRGSKKYPIYIYLQSPGGSIYAGLKFLTFAKTLKNVHTITNFSASMAAFITQDLPGKRYMTESGVYMFHRARGSFSGQFEDGEAEQRLKLWKRIVRKMESTSAKRIGITLKDYKEKVKDEWWLYGEDAVEAGVSDEVAQVKCSGYLMKKTKKVTKKTLFGSYEYEKSLCPLIN